MKRPSVYARTVVLSILCGCLGACAASPQPSAMPPDALWARFFVSDKPLHSCEISGSIRFGKLGETTRVSFVWTGQGGLPATMVLTEPTGSAAAEIRASRSGAEVIVPSENKRYFYGPGEAESRYGVPFSYEELAALLEGRYAVFLGGPERISETRAEDGVEYVFSGPYGRGTVTVSSDGDSMAMERGGWNIVVKGMSSGPDKIDARRGDDCFIVNIRQRK